jgi:hypothetical protein
VHVPAPTVWRPGHQLAFEPNLHRGKLCQKGLRGSYFTWSKLLFEPRFPGNWLVVVSPVNAENKTFAAVAGRAFKNAQVKSRRSRFDAAQPHGVGTFRAPHNSDK